MLARLQLDPGGNVQRLYRGKGGDPGRLAPNQEGADGLALGATGVRVADRSREEFEKTQTCSCAELGDQHRHSLAKADRLGCDQRDGAWMLPFCHGSTA